MREDRPPLRRAIQQADHAGQGNKCLIAKVEESRRLADWRRENRPLVEFPSTLPISEHATRLQKLIRQHPVLVVCGETGSGKSTQIPKICLAAGYGVHGMIGQTQPRRIAARSVAERISVELASPMGEAVGYRVRFHEQVSQRNFIRILTDGMLLAEFERDPQLERYDVLIIDEAHERSLNIDFLIGLSKRILRQRPEFRLVITSATLDSEKFSAHFDDAPVVSVSGRLYPVEIRYRPLTEEGNSLDAVSRGILDGIEELHGESPGDTLVFLPGEREIRDTTYWLANRIKPGIELLPLYARLTPAEQQRIFRPGGSTRIILATNVAETSLTVPGIRYVIDSGLARVSRYSPNRKLQRLPTEKISRAAADQRAGRCGRVASGICIRLFSEDDFASRAAYTDPEIVRTSLAHVILRMKTMGMGEIDTFPFMERPTRRQINDGLQHLIELGALDAGKRITSLGRRISRMPVDPRIARMLLAAEQEDCVEEIVVISAALSLPDPRQSPADQVQKAREKHHQLSNENSDFLVLLDIWRQFRSMQRTRSKRQAYRWCQENFLSVFRMREWAALQATIKQALKHLGIRLTGGVAEPACIHRALLSGLLSNIAYLSTPVQTRPSRRSGKGHQKNRGIEYDGTFGKTLQISPGSALSGQAAKWIMCAELVQTGRVMARTVAKVDATWIEKAGSHLLQMHYSSPHWDPRQERVIAFRRATLYGLTVYHGRKCDYSSINPEECRAIFLRSALVDGGLVTRLPFHQSNCALVEEIDSLAHRVRHRGMRVEDELYAFYDECIPPFVHSASSLRKWYRSLSSAQQEALCIRKERLWPSDPEEIVRQYPDRAAVNSMMLPLSYRYDPTSERDGVTVQIHLPLLNQVDGAALERLVPGLLSEKMAALIRTLPKPLRRQLVPVPDTVARLQEAVMQDSDPLLVAMAREIQEIRGVEVLPTDFSPEKLPAYLQLGLELVDERNMVLGFSRDIEGLQTEFGIRAQESFAGVGDPHLKRSGIRSWDFDELPRTIPIRVGCHELWAWPALVDDGDSVSVQLFDREQTAQEAHREGVRRLLWLTMPVHRKLFRQPLPDWQRVSLIYAPLGDLRSLKLAILHKAQDQTFFIGQEEVRDRKTFEDRVIRCGPSLPVAMQTMSGHVARVLSAWRQLGMMMREMEADLSEETWKDISGQLDRLIYDGFVNSTPVRWLPELERFMEGIRIRLERAHLDPKTDALRFRRIDPWWQRLIGYNGSRGIAWERFRWMLEEFRVSVFAQELRTSVRISAKRLEVAWQDVLQDDRLT